MPISCEECRENLGQLVPPQRLSTPSSGGATSASDAHANTAEAAAPLLREVRTSDTAPSHSPAHPTKEREIEHQAETREAEAHKVEAREVEREAEAHEIEAREVEAHVAGCEACSRELQRLRRMVSVLHDLPAVSTPVDLRARIRSQLQAERQAEASPMSTHAAAPAAGVAQTAANKKEIASDVEKSRGATDIKRDRAGGWSRFWTRALRHPAQATWAGGAVLCALALIVVSRAPNSFSLAPAPPADMNSTRAIDGATSKKPSGAPNPSSTNHDNTSQKATRNGVQAAPPTTSASSKTDSPSASAPEISKSNPTQPARARGERGAISHPSISSATPQSAPFQAPSNSTPPATAPKAVAPKAVVPENVAPDVAATIPAPGVADMSTHGGAERTTQSRARRKPESASAALSPHQDEQSVAPRAPRLARLELLPQRAVPRALEGSSFSLKASNGVSSRGAGSSSLLRSAPSQQADSARSATADEGVAPALSATQSTATAGAVRPSADMTAKAAARDENLAGSFNAPVASAPQASPSLRENEDEISSAESARRARSAQPAAGNVAPRSETAAVKKSTSAIPHRSGSAHYIDNNRINNNRSDNSGRVDVARSQSARLWVLPLRDAAKARVRVSLFGLAWSDAKTSSTASQPRIVWSGQARQNREIAIPLSFVASAIPVEGKAFRTLRVELQQERGDKWQTLQTQDMPVALP